MHIFTTCVHKHVAHIAVNEFTNVNSFGWQSHNNFCHMLGILVFKFVSWHFLFKGFEYLFVLYFFIKRCWVYNNLRHFSVPIWKVPNGEKNLIVSVYICLFTNVNITQVCDFISVPSHNRRPTVDTHCRVWTHNKSYKTVCHVCGHCYALFSKI